MKIYNEAQMNTDALNRLQQILVTLEKFIIDLNLDGFKGIKIISDSLLHSNSDGHMENKTIFLPKNKIQKYIYDGENDLIKSTLYHELCHIDLENKLPKLHSLHEKSVNIEDDITCFTIMIYIEYLAHLKSSNIETLANQLKFYNSINEYNWNFDDEVDKVYFIKYVPYIIGRDVNNKYLSSIYNKELKKRIEEIKKEFEKLSTTKLIDDYSILYDLEKIVKKYITND